LARKKKPVYGKRYETDYKIATVKAWRDEAQKPDGKSQQRFCKDLALSPITLNKWVKVYGDAPQAAAKTIVRHEIVAVDEPRAVAVIDGSVADIVEAIKKYQGTVADLKVKLHHWVDTL
jgi:hypothetical protein